MAVPSDRLTEITARLEEVRERAKAKIDEVRSRFVGGNPGGVLKLPVLERLRKEEPFVRRPRFLAAGPVRHISTPTRINERNTLPWFHNAHTKSEREIKAMGAGPLEKNTIALKKVAPKVLNK